MNIKPPQKVLKKVNYFFLTSTTVRKKIKYGLLERTKEENNGEKNEEDEVKTRKKREKKE